MADQKPLIIYHGKCADGFTAAWLANIYFHDKTGMTRPTGWVVDHHAAVYGKPPPDTVGRGVYILDFSYDVDTMIGIAAFSSSTVWIDHHISAIDAMRSVWNPRMRRKVSTERSGAYLTSLYFWPDKDPLEIVKMVDDRDRWVFAREGNRAFHASLFSRPYKIGEWNKASESIPSMIIEGEAIERKHLKDIEELLEVMERWMVIQGHRVPSANLSYMSASDACDLLLKKYPEAPFAATWFIRKDGMQVFSLRSRSGSDVDVSEVAKNFGGGGHKHSAGFAIDPATWGMRDTQHG